MADEMTNWRPPGWVVGDPDDPYVPEQIERLYAEYDAAGYYTVGGKLTDAAIGKRDETEARDVAHNRKLLRDAWNTLGVVWRLGSALIGRPFAVDPFWNAGARDLSDLRVTLDGLTPLTDGMLTVKLAREQMADYTSAVAAELRRRIAALGDDTPDDFPVNWRQGLPPGSAAAAVNGPHSCTAEWLCCAAAYGTREFAAAFVPDAGDGWFQDYAMPATFVVRLGRIPCHTPPGIKPVKNPRGTSALCVYVPTHVRARVQHLAEQRMGCDTSAQRREIDLALDQLLPFVARRVLLTGQSVAVPILNRPRAGTQYALVQRGGLLGNGGSVVDLGLI